MISKFYELLSQLLNDMIFFPMVGYNEPSLYFVNHHFQEYKKLVKNCFFELCYRILQVQIVQDLKPWRFLSTNNILVM